jgi:hypothetical protein
VELESADVQRSAIVSKILDIYGGATGADGSNGRSGGEPKKMVDMDKAMDKDMDKEDSSCKVNNNYDFTNNNNDAALIPRDHVLKYMRK